MSIFFPDLSKKSTTIWDKSMRRWTVWIFLKYRAFYFLQVVVNFSVSFSLCNFFIWLQKYLFIVANLRLFSSGSGKKSLERKSGEYGGVVRLRCFWSKNLFFSTEERRVVHESMSNLNNGFYFLYITFLNIYISSEKTDTHIIIFPALANNETKMFLTTNEKKTLKKNRKERFTTTYLCTKSTPCINNVFLLRLLYSVLWKFPKSLEKRRNL